MKKGNYGQKVRNTLGLVFKKLDDYNEDRPLLFCVRDMFNNYKEKTGIEGQFSDFVCAVSNSFNYRECDVRESESNFLQYESMAEIMKGLMSTSPQGFLNLYRVLMNFKVPKDFQDFEDYEKNGFLPLRNNERYTELFIFANELTEKYYKYLDNLVSSCSDSNQLHEILFKYEKNSFGRSYYELDERQGLKINKTYQDIFAVRFLNDLAVNVNLNLNSIKKFYDYYEDKIPQDRKKNFSIIKTMIKEFNELDKLSEKRKDHADFVKVYNKYASKNLNYAEIFYSCFNYAKQMLAEDYVKSCTDLTQFELKEYEDFPEVKVYNCGKQPFKMFISCTSEDRSYVDKKLVNWERRSYDLLSCSYISNDCMYTFRNLKTKFAFGFTNFDPKLIHLMNSYDNYSTFRFNDYGKGVRHPIEFLSPEAMIEETLQKGNYNEFGLISFSKDRSDSTGKMAMGLDRIPELKPSCIFCLNDVEEAEFELAKKMKIPIMLVENENYKYFRETFSTDVNKYDKSAYIEQL